MTSFMEFKLCGSALRLSFAVWKPGNLGTEQMFHAQGQVTTSTELTVSGSLCFHGNQSMADGQLVIQPVQSSGLAGIDWMLVFWTDHSL